MDHRCANMYDVNQNPILPRVAITDSSNHISLPRIAESIPLYYVGGRQLPTFGSPKP